MMCLKEKIGISYFIWQITHLISIQLLYSIWKSLPFLRQKNDFQPKMKHLFCINTDLNSILKNIQGDEIFVEYFIKFVQVCMKDIIDVV
jgi:hypothetical protein